MRKEPRMDEADRDAALAHLGRTASAYPAAVAAEVSELNHRLRAEPVRDSVASPSTLGCTKRPVKPVRVPTRAVAGEGMNLSEAAQILSIKTAATRARYSRAPLRIRRALSS